MKISAIQSPIFTPLKKLNNISFVSRPDSFEKSEFDFDKELEAYYSKLQKNMGVVTPRDIVLQANRISQRTHIKINDVYKTMGVLSQYSSYKSFSVIQKELRKHYISSVNNLDKYYYKNNLKLPVCLTNILHYLSLKNFNFYNHSDNNALFVDGNLIEIALNDPEFYKDPYSKLFYIENFENGYNFLNQSKSFEDYTVDIIEKAKNLRKYTGKDYDYNLHYVLNGYVMENINAVSNGGQVNVIKTENICTPEKIADNLNPIMPDYGTFKEILNSVAFKDTLSTLNGEKYVIDSMNNNLEVVTPKRLSKYLQEMHSKITKYLKDNNKDLDKVYYVIPNKDKSFALINYQYQNANEIIDMPNYFMSRNSNGPHGLDIKALPEDATLIVMDDYMLSGQSMLREQFPYETLIFTDKLFKNKNISVVFAPIFATKNGIKEFQEFIDKTGRKGKDCIITAKVFPKIKTNNLISNDLRTHKYSTSTVMPYMGPDSNLEEFISLYEKFLYSSDAQKQPLSDFGFLEW